MNWFGDSLDGTLARVRQQQRPNYGYYLDHVLDIAGMTAMCAGLAAGGLMSPVLAVSLLAAYVAAMAESFLATAARGVFRMSFLRFGPTELRVVLMAGALRVVTHPAVSVPGVGALRLFDAGGAVAVAGLALAFLVSAARNGVALYRAEPLPQLRTGRPPAVVDRQGP